MLRSSYFKKNQDILSMVGIFVVINLLVICVMYVYFNANKEPIIDFNTGIGIITSAIVAAIIASFSTYQMGKNKKFLVEIKGIVKDQADKIVYEESTYKMHQQNAHTYIKHHSKMMKDALEDLKNNTFVSDAHKKTIEQLSKMGDRVPGDFMKDHCDGVYENDFKHKKEDVKNHFEDLKKDFKNFDMYLDAYEKANLDNIETAYQRYYPEIEYLHENRIIEPIIHSIEALWRRIEMNRLT